MDGGISWSSRQFYDIATDSDIHRVSGYHGRREHYVDVPVYHKDGTLRDRIAMAKAMITKAVEKGFEPGLIGRSVFEDRD